MCRARATIRAAGNWATPSIASRTGRTTGSTSWCRKRARSRCHRRRRRRPRRSDMRVAIIGQQDFGKAVLEAFLARGDQVAAVFCAPEKPGARADALKVAAQEKGVPLFQFQSLKSPEATAKMRE